MAPISAFEILNPGFLTTLQDLGRIGFGRYGVAPSGALDPFALRVGNLLVNNPEDEAGLEITLTGFKTKVLEDVVAAISGADLGCHLNGKPLKPWCARLLKRGDFLVFKEINRGCRAYLTVGGGFCVPEVMGSKSTNLSSGFGGIGGRSLQPGDILDVRSPQLHFGAQGRKFDLNSTPAYANFHDIRVLPGPQSHHFDDETVDIFMNADYRVSSQSDRTGIRLEGPSLKFKSGQPESIISEGIVAGAVQVPGDGQPIIVLNETVSGGYRKIATVITADIHLLGQVLPGDRLRFTAVDLREAREALWRVEEKIARLRNALK